MQLDHIGKNWKTTTGGVVLLGLAAAHSLLGITIPGMPLPSLDPATITLAITAIMAKDADVSGK